MNKFQSITNHIITTKITNNLILTGTLLVITLLIIIGTHEYNIEYR